MTYQISTDVRLDVIQCGCCDIWFAIPEAKHDKMKSNGVYIYCPNGHYIGYDKSEISKLKDKLEQANKQIANTQFELMTERNAHQSTQRKLRRTMKRVSNGICPCCNRQFVNLRRHMEGKHPDYVSPTRSE